MSDLTTVGAGDTHSLVATETERLSRQGLLAAIADEAIFMVELLIVLYELDVTFQDIPADFTLLGKALMVAFIAYQTALVFCERLASQRFSASCTIETITVVGTFVTCDVLDGTFNEAPACNAPLGVVGTVAVLANLQTKKTLLYL